MPEWELERPAFVRAEFEGNETKPRYLSMDFALPQVTRDLRYTSAALVTFWLALRRIYRKAAGVNTSSERGVSQPYEKFSKNKANRIVATAVVRMTIRQGRRLCGALSACPGIIDAPASSCVCTPNGITTNAVNTQNRA